MLRVRFKWHSAPLMQICSPPPFGAKKVLAKIKVKKKHRKVIGFAKKFALKKQEKLQRSRIFLQYN